jgi:hypothetical protein
MRIILAVVVALISQVLAQVPAYQAFTADFQAVAPQWGTGYFTGTIQYDWPQGYMQLTFNNAGGYTEFYQFNTDKGYNPNVPTGQFTYQYLYKSSTNCPCETTALQFAMPALWVTAEVSKATATGIDYWVNGISPPRDTNFKGASTCTQYYANFKLNIQFPDGSQRGYFLSNSLFKDSQGVPAGFAINDIQQRTFTLSNVKAATSPLAGLKPPTTGCKCGKMLDIVLSLDRSGSIKIWQWQLEFAFTQNLTNAFEYGPLKTNMGIVNWNAAQWPTIDIQSGNALQSVQTAVNSMKCCPDSKGVIPTASDASCCCCGTPIGGGLWEGSYMLATRATRSKATKVLIILTDGCQNHIWNTDASGATGTATQCPNCATEKLCAQNTNCTSDITKWYKWSIRNVPGLKIIAVGVGDQTTICTDQLLLAAGGDPTNVYNPQSWQELQTIVQTISATACTTNDTLCPDCCGICTCGVCNPAKTCYDKDKCNLGVVDPGTGCCSTTPVQCDAGPCQIASCNPTTGCETKPITCKPDELCYRWYCNATSVICTTEKIVPSPVGCSNITVIPQCFDKTDCNDNNNCTIDDCVGGKCVRTNVVCQPDNACNQTVCKRTLGCVTTTKKCDDGNYCTNEKCDPILGCVYTNVTCPTTKDFCKRPICTPALGCDFRQIEYQKECNMTAGNCTAPACNGTCYEKYICATPTQTGTEDFPTTVVLSSALGGAAVAGIVIGAAVLAAGVGGGAAVAIAGAAGAGGVVTVHSNPVYAGAGTAGNNPLHKQD